MARYDLDDDTTARLLAGAVHPDDAPPGFELVAALLGQAARPAGLAPEAAATVAAMAAAIRAAAPVVPARRRGRLGRILTAKLAAVAGVAALSTGAAAATGSLPDSLQDAVANAATHVGLNLPDPAQDHADVGGKSGESHGQADEAGGPDDPGVQGTSDEIRPVIEATEGPKGPAVSPIASDGQSQAGQEHPAGGQPETPGKPEQAVTPEPPVTPEHPEPPVDGQEKAGDASGGASSAGPANSNR